MVARNYKGESTMIKNIDIYELKNIILDKNILIIDTREYAEYKKRRLPGAINLELENVDDILQICPDKNKKILIYCTKGIRSIVVAGRLDELGYTQIFNLDEGIEKILKKY